MKAKPQFARAAVLSVFTLAATLCARAQTTPPSASQLKKAPAQQQANTREPNVPAKGTAIVELHDGLLHISASDADLNTVLQQVAHVTGMRLQGSAGGDRVFGDYGPAAPTEVLNHLLDGLPCNFVLKQEPGTDAPEELVISARNGAGITAPPVPAARDASRRRFIPPATQANAPQEQPEQPEQAEPVEETPVEQAAPEIPTPPPAAQDQPEDNSGAPNPNTIKTPQQFMDEVNRRRQQLGEPPQ